MVDDLLPSQRLIGLGEAEVMDLLGEPNSVTDEGMEKVSVYHLARQRDYPAKSIFFPGCFPNHEAWMLQVVFREGKVESASVFFT